MKTKRKDCEEVCFTEKRESQKRTKEEEFGKLANPSFSFFLWFAFYGLSMAVQFRNIVNEK